jgi:hypothetical protein
MSSASLIQAGSKVTTPMHAAVSILIKTAAISAVKFITMRSLTTQAAVNRSSVLR